MSFPQLRLLVLFPIAVISSAMETLLFSAAFVSLSEAPQGLDNRAGGYKIDIRTKQKQGWDPQFSWRFIGLINREEFWLNAGGL